MASVPIPKEASSPQGTHNGCLAALIAYIGSPTQERKSCVSRVPFALLLTASLILLAHAAYSQISRANAAASSSIMQSAAATGDMGGTRFPVSLPNGRVIDPAGHWITLAPFPFALALSPDGQQAVAPSIGWPFSLNIIDHPAATLPVVTRIPKGSDNDPDVQVHTGVVYSPDGTLVYDATGDTGAVDILSTSDWHRIARIPLDKPTLGHEKTPLSFSASLALTADGKYLYALDQGNWRVVVIDTASRQTVAAFATGSNPFTLALSPDGHRLYISNSGLFEYKVVDGVKREDTLNTGLRFPPYGYPSRAAREGVTTEGHRVDGLGDENSTRGSSLWTYDVTHPLAARLIAQLRLGATIRVGRNRVVGGASPSGVAAGSQHIYVALAHEDSVAVISPDGRRLEQQITLTPFAGSAFVDAAGRPLRGVMPCGLALDGARLYVAEAGINAVAVVDTQQQRVLGHWPVGWYPVAVSVSLDRQQLYVISSKGTGSGPNADGSKGSGKQHRGGTYIGELEFGSLSVIPLGHESGLADGTVRVLHNNQIPTQDKQPLPRLKHVFLIVRENRTYDEILGDVEGSDGEPRLARWGMHGWAEESATARNLAVTPNAHALVARFATSDRYFVDSDVSADGHRWAMGIAPTPWMDIAWTSNYGGRRTSDTFSTAPGRRALIGGADAPMPEDEPEFGSIWEHVAGAGLPLFNYGEGLEVEGSDERAGAEPEGQRLYLNAPIPEPIFESTDRAFPTFNLGIPDQLRSAEFTRDFKRRVARGYTPALTVIRLPGDHTADPRPGDGYPYRASYVADNDLALGKIIETISHSAIWKDSAIFVTEDDAQGGVDHVDAHRSPLLIISPWVRPGYISHRHSSMASIQKTIYELLGLGPLNLEDALSSDLSDAFAAEPDNRPFVAVPSDLRVFDPKTAKMAHPRTAAEARRLLDCDDPREISREFHKSAE